MGFTLIDDAAVQTEDSTPDATDSSSSSLVGDALSFGEGVLHSGASAVTKATSAALGTPGEILGFINDFVAAPLTSLITGEKSIPYKDLPLSQVAPQISQVESAFHTDIPYTKPRNDYEKKLNDIVETTTQLLIPGAQAKIGRYAGAVTGNPVVRSFFKSVGSETVKEGVKSLTGSETGGDLAKAGSLLFLSFMDRANAGKYLSGIYNIADNALTRANNPSWAAPRLRSGLENLKSRLSTGTLAPSEQAVVGDIESILNHFNGNDIPVQNMWGSVRSLNEKMQDVIKSAAGKQGRSRARKLYSSVTKLLNKELSSYGKTNPSFGQPFKEAQEGFGTLAQSNVISRWSENNLNYEPLNKVVPYLFGGAVGGAIGKGVSALTPQTLLAPALYQSGKVLYRIFNSPTLRKYYLQALQGAVRENASLFNKSVKKLDEKITEEDESKPSFQLID